MIEANDKMIDAGIGVLNSSGIAAFGTSGISRAVVDAIWEAMAKAAEEGGDGDPEVHPLSKLGAALPALAAKFAHTEEHLQGPTPQPSWTPPSTDKIVNMQLSWIDATKRYKIITISNTGYYKPDQWILEPDIATISAMKGWNFSVSSPDYLAMLFGLVKNIPLPML